MKNLQYGVPRIFFAITRRLLESFSTVCGNFREEPGQGRRRNEVTVETDERLRERRGKWNEDRGLRRWMIQPLKMSHSRPEKTHHQRPSGSGIGKERESNNSTPRAIRNAAVTSPRHRAYKDKEAHTCRSKDLLTTFHQKTLTTSSIFDCPPSRIGSLSSCSYSYASCSSYRGPLSVLAAVRPKVGFASWVILWSRRCRTCGNFYTSCGIGFCVWFLRLQSENG